MKKAIVTGATSVIGVPLIKVLLDQGFSVFAVCRVNSEKKDSLPKSDQLSVVECDVNCISALTDLIKDRCDYFFHLAWNGVSQILRGDTEMQSKDILNTLSAVQAAKKMGCKKFIGVGSQAEIGLTNQKIGCNPCCAPETPYGIAKYAAGKMSQVLCKQLGLAYNWCRIISAYCEDDHSYTMMSNLISNLINDKDCDLSDGTQIWDCLHAADVAKAIYLVGEKGVNNKCYPIGSGEGYPLKKYILDTFSAVEGCKSKLNFGAIPFNEKSIRYLCADIAELQKDTGFKQEIPFCEGIARVVAAHRERNEH